MRSQPPSLLPANRLLSEIARAKAEPRRSRLVAAIPTVEARLALLDSRGPLGVACDDLGHACAGADCSHCLYVDLRHLWSGFTSSLRRLKRERSAELRDIDKGTCPYCGIDTPNTWDHYLPKATFPEYSVAPSNLIWICAMCNWLKAETPPNGSDRFLEPTLDPVSEPLLRCSIETVDGLPVPTMKFNRPVISSLGCEDEVLFHVGRLDLLTRFKRVSSPQVASFLLEVATLALTPADAAEVAVARAKSDRAVFGPNRWTVLLFDALADWYRGQQA
jgi:5-methylcytosine-specific restriction endonuclease McrA